MNRRFSLPHLMGAIASYPKRFAATAASALCVLMLAAPSWGQVVTIGPATTTVQEEDEDMVVLTVAADSDPSNRLIVTYQVTGTAKADYDYTALTTTEVVFTGTDTEIDLTIAIKDDQADEGDTDETIIVTLTAVSGGDTPSLGTATVATINIDDDDAAAETANFAITNANKEALAKVVVDEGGDDATYMVALSKKPKEDVTVEIKEYKAEADKDKADRLTISPATLMFTDENYNKPQAVMVSAGLDENDTDEMVMISHKPMGEDFEDDVEATLFPVDVVDQENPRMVAVRLSEASQAVSPMEDTYGVGEKILLEVEFSKPVKVVGAPQLKVLVDDKPSEEDEEDAEEAEDEDKHAQYMPPENEDGTVSDEPSAILTFAYTVQKGDEDKDGIGVPDTNPLVLAAGDAILEAMDEDDADAVEVAALTKAAKGTFTITIPAAVTKVDADMDFLLRAHAGDDQEEVDEDKTITLDGSKTTTGDAGNVTYIWKLKGCDPTATINSPEWLTCPKDDVTLDGKDGEAKTADDFTHPAADVVNFGEDDKTAIKLEGKTVSFDTGKSLKEDITLTFELIVINTRTEETSKDEVVLEIEADDDDPVANAGGNITAEEGTVVFLIGSGSADPEGGDVTYSWKLKDGDGSPSYIASMEDFDSEIAVVQLRANIGGSPKITFELTVTDAGGNASESAEAVVTIVPSNLGEVLEHSLSRFSRTMAASAVDTLTERFGQKLGHSPSGLAMNLGGGNLSFAGMDPGAVNGLNVANAMGMMTQGKAYAEDGADSLAANSMSGVGSPEPFVADHFGERALVRTNSFNPFKFADLDRQAIMGSGFEFTMGGSDGLGAFSGSGGGSKFAIWGRFDSRSFEAEPTDSISLDATTNIGYVGGDMRFGADQNIVVGLAVSTAKSEVEYTQGDVQGVAPHLRQAVAQAIAAEDADAIAELEQSNILEGEITFNMTTFYPYASMDITDNVTLWGMLGVGSGDAEITSTVGHLIETDTSMFMFAVGGRGELQSMGATDLAFKADAFTVSAEADDVAGRNIKDIETIVQRVRGGLEASRLFPMGGAYLRGSAELAVRADAGDAENGLGLEINLGAAYENDMGLAVEGRVRHLAVHSADDIAETGFSIMGRFDPAGVGGASLTFAPTWGDMASAADAMWQGEQPMFYDGLTGQGSNANAFHMNTELAYAFLTRKWSIAPYGLLTVNGAYERERFGLRIAPLAITNGHVSLDFFGEQVGGRAIEPGMRATMRLRLR